MTYRLLANLILIATILGLAACKPYRIEYHRRPSFHKVMSIEPLEDRVVLEDGSVIVYSDRVRATSDSVTQSSDTERFKIREEMTDGTVVLRALLPAHVVAHTLYCLKLHEYQLLWDQVLSEETKQAYAAEGKGVEEFTAYMKKHRTDLAKMLNRMRLGFVTHEVVVENVGAEYIICRFWPRVGELFKFKRVEIVREGFGLKLAMIR